MNREQRRAQARQKKRGETHADVLAKRRIGKQTLRMAMEDQAVALAADIKCQQMLWGAVIALNERFGFGEKRTRDFLEATGEIAEEFDAMVQKNGYEYAEEKLRQRASQVSGVEIHYQHEMEIEAWKQMMTQGSGGGGRPVTAPKTWKEKTHEQENGGNQHERKQKSEVHHPL